MELRARVRVMVRVAILSWQDFAVTSVTHFVVHDVINKHATANNETIYR